MLKINRKVEYALMALKFMTSKKEGELTSARELCEKFNVPFDTIAKVLQVMNNHNIVRSTQGVKGGYLLTKELDKISYLHLCEIIDPGSNNGNCETIKPCSISEYCNIRRPIKKLNNKLINYLGKITINDLLFGEID